MLSAKRLTWAVCGALAVALLANTPTSAADELYAPPGAAKLKVDVQKWLASQNASQEIKKQVNAIWADADENTSSRALFQKVIDSFAAANPAARAFIESCRLDKAPLKAPKLEEKLLKGQSEFFTANMRLFYARYLTQRKMYDEALAAFKDLNPKTVADPATHLFFKSVCQHQLLQQKEGLKTIDALLKNTESVPVSYTNVANLMQYDLQQHRDKTLKAISLKMRDSERRLDLARGGQKVQQVQDEIIADLDELIEKLEQQGGSGQGCGSGQSGQGKTNQPSSNAKDSRILGKKEEGKADPSKLKKDRKGWGNLPPSKIEEIKNLISRKYPPHYARAIEAYTKKQAERTAPAGK
ncbi:MAG: hypothetical protein Tsb009_38200 [Planctomycetaceae bacterium]